MKKLHKLVMLPTEKASNILIVTTDKMAYRDRPKGKLEYHDSPWETSVDFEAQHLYLLSDEEIKSGDWFVDFDTIDKKPIQALPSTDLTFINHGSKLFKKIITTTDELYIDWYEKHTSGQDRLPQFPETFIKKFVESQGKITEVDVEYENWRGEGEGGHSLLLPRTRLKLGNNNTIIISPFKTYSREEVVSIIYSFAKDWNTKEVRTSEWIEENL